MNPLDEIIPSVYLSEPPSALRPLRTISPSRFQSLSGCKLREIWNSSTSDTGRHLPPWPAARVGTIIHKLLELAARNKIKDNNTEECWRDLVIQSERDLAKSWVTRALLPLNRTQPSFEVRMYRALKRSAEVLGCYSRPEEQSGNFGPEIKVQSHDGLVRGAIDLVRRSEHGPILVDYKTGALFESEGDGLSIKSEYVTQMTLYAALYFEHIGTWPADLELVPLKGQSLTLTFERQHAMDLLEQAKQSLRAVNSSIAEGVPLKLLASASADTCKFCQHRPLCPAFLSEADSLAASSFPFDVFGELKAIHKQTAELVSLELQTATGETCEVKEVRFNFDRHPVLATAAPGSKLAIFNLKQDIRFGQFIEMPALTTMYFR